MFEEEPQSTSRLLQEGEAEAETGSRVTVLQTLFQTFAIVNFAMGLITLMGFNFSPFDQKIKPVY
jgi:hypothetical protein